MVELLYSKYYSQLLCFCYSISRNSAFAEDVVQEAFLRALANADILNDLPEYKCRAWLYRTAKNIIIDNARRMAKCPEPEEEAFNEDDYSSVTVQMMCRQLPENERTLFHLRYFEGYNATELGEMFDMPSATIRSKLASARAKLRKMLNESEGEV
ncbi:MAG: sigma-70 family RNA polymerase sigma factor [Clostridiaceae bacterium]|jgi:RNA polymerase sigma-70 factor (ECF subfamily)|nr:sigma-70 family RNA polymerase sigma factor [Clostridiaceae bacterium]